jgi:uncharacterized protein YdeI (YjbR/CyaY-like superfamily)
MEDKILAYINKHSQWRDELVQLRTMLLSTELSECVKWGMPTYVLDKKNIVSFSAFKNHYGMWFFQGVFLNDKAGILRNAQEGKTKAMRQVRIESGDKVDIALLKQYVEEAIQNQKDGKEVKKEKPKSKSKDQKLSISPELNEALDKQTAVKKLFLNLTAIQQRDYHAYINQAKRQATKLSRLEKILPKIAEGKPISSIWTKDK